MNIPKISSGAWIRTIVLLITVINAILMMFHKHLLPYDENDATHFVNWIYAVISAVGLGWGAFRAWWKDNSFTKKARIQKEQIKIQTK